ncbi:hypothetical protein NOW01_07010 [Anoxybacillus salavatliensis]|nr:hypothetical protein [Anoxybacillus gonensis]MCQ5364756.1 hypothetical protein [Anoxybacillus gonensis]
MEVKVKLSCLNVEEAKRIVKQLLEIEKEHSPRCTLIVEIEIS